MADGDAVKDLVVALEWAMGQLQEPIHENSNYGICYDFARTVLLEARAGEATDRREARA